MVETIDVLTWVFIVFVAGFIGYFGRHLAKRIIAKFSKKKEQKPSQTIIHQHESPEKYKFKAEIEKQKAKIEKKKLKIEKKRLKALKKKKK